MRPRTSVRREAMGRGPSRVLRGLTLLRAGHLPGRRYTSMTYRVVAVVTDEKADLTVVVLAHWSSKRGWMYKAIPSYEFEMWVDKGLYKIGPLPRRV